MEQHQEAYAAPCTECDQFENCSPSMCQRLNAVESELREVKTILLQLAEKKNISTASDK